MDNQIRKLKRLRNQHLGQSKVELEKIFGKPCKNSDTEIWFYRKIYWGIFKYEIAFIFEENLVIDIMLTQYIFCVEYKTVFCYEGQNPEYKVIKQF